MKRILVLAAIVATAATSPVHAQGARVSDSRFMAASDCLALADHRALQSDAPDVNALRQLVRENRYRVHSIARERADDEAQQIRRANPRRESGVQFLRERRDAACAPFVSQGLVQLNPGAAAS